ncbi:MAG: potassium channel protein [Tenacibaculum sp.]|nr:potassium channel protein [Tenacibaculum sp.]
MIRIVNSKFYKALILLLLVVVMGVVGYMLISNLSFIDALYMTIITMSTVGFGEVTDLSSGGRLFTILLILMSVTIFGYFISVFTELLVSGQFVQQIKMKKAQKKIKELQNHTIICGFGRNGIQAVNRLRNYNKNIIVIEQDKELIKKLELEDILCLYGDATTDETLLEAGIKKADNLITALPSDADNLFVVLSASQLNKNCKIISRASKESSYQKLKFAGADNVIMPDKLGGEHMASLVVTPDVIEFVDRLTISGETTTNLEEIEVNDLPEFYLHKTILDLDLRRKTGCTVIGYKTPNADYIINPEANTKLVEDSFLIVLGRSEQISKLRELF